MKFLIILFGLYVTFSLSFGVAVPSLLSAMQGGENERFLLILKYNLEKSLNELSRRTVNEQNFPNDRLSDEFLIDHRPAIQDIYNQYNAFKGFLYTWMRIYEIIFSISHEKIPKKSRSLRKKLRGKYRAQPERIEGFGRKVSILICSDIYRKKRRFIFKDDGLLIALINSMTKFYEAKTDREAELQEALKKQMPDSCLVEKPESTNEEEKEEELCASCYEGQSLHHLKCCGNVYHKKCLEKWWRTLNNNQPFHCPLCQRSPDQIKD